MIAELTVSHVLLMASHTVFQVAFTPSMMLLKVSCSHFHEASHTPSMAELTVSHVAFIAGHIVSQLAMRRTIPATSAAIAMMTSPIGLAAMAALNSHIATVAAPVTTVPATVATFDATMATV